MGYSLRTDRFRYVEWRDLTSGEVTDCELYDHVADPRESINVINEPRLHTAVAELQARARQLAPASPAAKPPTQ